jgi:hypothetical protein
LCSHTVGVLSRALEQAGLATVGITMVREHTEKVKPPRALWVPYPYGRPLGRPEDPELQRRVIRAALELLDAPAGPVLADFDDDQVAGEPALPQASDTPLAPDLATDVAFEVTSLRPYYEQWLAHHGGRTAVGVSGIDQRRFRGAIRFLEALARGEDADMTERAAEAAREQFVRWVIDDLKAFYLEARMAQYPRASERELYTWFWSHTALSSLLRTFRDRLKANGDPKLDQLAFGIAR